MGKIVITFGSTGETGKRILSKLIASNLISEIHLMNRHLQGINHPKVIEHLIDFEHPESFTNIPHADAAICTLGTTIKKAGSKRAFEQVDFHHVLHIATWAKQRCGHFIVVSSFGANADSNNFYLKTKGNLENALKDMQWPQLSIFRPGLLLGKRKEFRLLERLSGYLMTAFNPLMIGPLRAIKATKMDTLASAIVKRCTLTDTRNETDSETSLAIYSNPEIEQLSELR